jgi:hypothetical protein
MGHAIKRARALVTNGMTGERSAGLVTFPEGARYRAGACRY